MVNRNLKSSETTISKPALAFEASLFTTAKNFQSSPKDRNRNESRELDSIMSAAGIRFLRRM